MINHIDVSSVLRQTVCELYSDLVTRPTGAAVRGHIEQQIAGPGASSRTLTVIDFSHVGLLDFSCADEVIAKLLLRYGTPPSGSEREVFFVFRGVNESHLDAIETVLDRHGLAMVVQLEEGGHALVGSLSHEERLAWEHLAGMGAASAAQVAAALDLDAAVTADALQRLALRRLVMVIGDKYVPVGVTS